ncbi:MAG: glutamate--tRNA ligase [Patescibacteria group bacterium]
MIKTRFAPSPTGYLHVGGLRTALFDYLLAKQNNGSFVLRIEDTDRNRLVQDGIENILKSLNWAGLEIDEGVVFDNQGKINQKGDCGPYIQSERLEIYHKYIDQLINQGDAYYCFCDKNRLEELRKEQELNKKPTGYDGHCRNLNIEEAKKRIAQGEKYVVRMKMPKTGETILEDLVRGQIVFKNEISDDQVILKEDGFPTYHLAVVVDDHLMGITHVIRGEEWLSSVPKHITLYKMFNWELPQFAHLPLLLNPDKSKLSKRQGDVAVEDYTKKGYLPEALINFAAFLGWNPGTDQEIFSLEELIKSFDFKKVNKSGAVFNLEKLDWLNGQYIKKMSLNKLTELTLPFFEKTDWWSKYEIKDKEQIAQIIALEKDRAKILSTIPEAVKFIFELPDYEKELLIWKKTDLDETKNKLKIISNFLQEISNEEWEKEILEKMVFVFIEKNNFGVGDILWPLRIAISGQKNSPGPFEIMAILKKEETIKRINLALKK